MITQHLLRYLATNVHHYCTNTHDAEDLIQETLLRILKYPTHIKDLPETKQHHYAYGVMHRTWIDHYRRKKRSPLTLTTEEPATTNEPLDELLTHEEHTLLTDTLHTLPDGTLTLTAALTTYKETAALHHLSLSAVKMRIKRFKTKARHALAPYYR